MIKGSRHPDPWLALATWAEAAGPAPGPNVETAARGGLLLQLPCIRPARGWELAEGDVGSVPTATFSPTPLLPLQTPLTYSNLGRAPDTEATAFQKLHGSCSSAGAGPITALVLCHSQRLCSPIHLRLVREWVSRGQRGMCKGQQEALVDEQRKAPGKSESHAKAQRPACGRDITRLERWAGAMRAHGACTWPVVPGSQRGRPRSPAPMQEGAGSLSGRLRSGLTHSHPHLWTRRFVALVPDGLRLQKGRKALWLSHLLSRFLVVFYE